MDSFIIPSAYLTKVSNGRVNDELEGTNCDSIEVISRHVPGGTEVDNV
jgi:hypothetical protein